MILNKFTTEDIPILQLSNGDMANIQLIQFNKKATSENDNETGPIVYIQSSMHGAEIQGSMVIYHLIDFFQHFPFNGNILLVPHCNPFAINNHQGSGTQGRFDSASGENWNRLYVDVTSKSEDLTGFDIVKFVEQYHALPEKDLKILFKKKLKDAYKTFQQQTGTRGHHSGANALHLQLQSLASTADVVLDLHTGPVATDYLYVAEYMEERSRAMLFPHTLVIPNEFAGAMDEASFIPWVRLEQEMKKRNFSFHNHFDAFTVELGGEEFIRPEEARLQAWRLLHYLKTKGVCLQKDLDNWWGIKIPTPKVEKQFRCLLKDYKRYYAPAGGVFHFIKKPGDKVKEGELFGELYVFRKINPQQSLDQIKIPVLARHDCIVIYHHSSSIVREGSTLFQVMEKLSVVPS